MAKTHILTLESYYVKIVEHFFCQSFELIVGKKTERISPNGSPFRKPIRKPTNSASLEVKQNKSLRFNILETLDLFENVFVG